MAEINYNNLYNQLKPMEQRYYDQQFSKNYVPGQENIMLSSQPAYEQMKSVYEAQQEIPETGFFDSIFGSASAAEPPAIPNLTYRNITPTFNLGTGITNTKSATPFINTGQVYQNLQNTDLVNQLIQENQMKANIFSRPNMMNVAGGGITEIKNQMIEELKPESLGIDTSYGVAPLQNLGIDTSYGVANTPDVIGQARGLDIYEADDGTPYYIEPSTGKAIVAPDTVEAYKRQSGYYGKEPSGIAKLFEFLGNLPTPMNILRGGLESLQGFNQRIRSTPFAQSKTLAEFFNKRREAKEREAISNVYKDAGDRGTLGPGGGFSTEQKGKEGAFGTFGEGRGRKDY